MVSFTLTRSGPVDLAVFDTRGLRVATLASGSFPAGPHEVTWNGRGGSGGRALPGGVYYVRALGPGFSAARKVVLVGD